MSHFISNSGDNIYTTMIVGFGNQSEEEVSPYVDEMLRNQQFITRRLYRSESGRGELYDGETHMYLGDRDDNIFDVFRFIYRNFGSRY